MSIRQKTVLIAIIIIVVLLIVFLLLKFTGNNGTEVKVAKVIRGELIVTVGATGTVRSNNEAKLTTTASGKVSKIMVEENQFVKKGAILLELDSANQTERDYRRMSNLGKKGFVSSQQVELAKEQWENTFIIAPFSGTIAKKFVEVGEPLVGGTPAFLLADLNDMIVETNIDETDIGRVKVGQSAEVVLDAYKDTKIKGYVQFIARTSLEVKEKGITYLVKIKLDSTDVILRLGMTCDVNIRVTSKGNILMVPYTSIGEDKESRFVFVVEKNVLKKKYVKTGLENYDNTEIISGLNENEIIVESNISKLKDKEKVNIKSK